MTRFSRNAGRVTLGSLAAVALAALAVAPAGAHTGQLYTVADHEEDYEHYATISATDAAIAPFAPPISASDQEAEGLEIYQETGYALLERYNDEDVREYALGVWDHSTGTTTSQVPLVPAGLEASITELWELDTTTDGRILSLAFVEILEGEFPLDYAYVVEIDPVTGEVFLRVDLSDIGGDADPFLDSIATDPTTGVTYVFFDFDGGLMYASAIDLDGGTYAEPVALSGILDALGGGYFLGADFDTAGTLWFLFSPFNDDWLLGSTVGAFSASVSGVAHGTIDEEAIDSTNLAYDPDVAPQLADTGWDGVALAAGGVLALLAGVGAFMMGRRRAA